MNKELKLWLFAADKLKRGESLILLVVAESAGSSPGRQGFKMIVSENEIIGSIGGGVMETSLVQSAKCKVQSSDSERQSQFLNSKSEIVEMVHRKDSVNASGMICSGRQTLIFYKLNRSDLETVEKIASALRENRACELRITNDALQIGEDEKPNGNFRFEKNDSGEFVYEELLGCKNKLFIIGGGHCALALSELASKLDFHISLFDDRQDLNTLTKNEFADKKTILDSYENVGDFIESGANVYVVVMTLGYAFDEIVIRRLIDKDFKYFGVLGSRAKMKTLLKKLEKMGASAEKLKCIRTPIGLEINSRTPEEIAVSIAAEIIAVKNAKEIKSQSKFRR